MQQQTRYRALFSRPLASEWRRYADEPGLSLGHLSAERRSIHYLRTPTRAGIAYAAVANASLPFVFFVGHRSSSVPVSRPAEPLRGAWRIIQSSLTTGDTTTINASPQPGLVLFTDRHYSLMYVEGQLPRKLFTDPVRPTDAEKLEAYDTFVGHSGSYSVSDSLIVMEVVISKWPNLMGSELRNTFARFAHRIAGDTLRLTRRSTRAVFTITLRRVE